MKISTSVELVWQLAMREAIHAHFNELAPEHFMEGVLKFAEMPVEKLKAVGAEGGGGAKIAGEIAGLRGKLRELGLDPTLARRRLRDSMGRGDTPHQGDALHRSGESRAIFETAAAMATKAGSDALTVMDLLMALLERPTSRLAALSKPSSDPRSLPERDTPQLDSKGRDLTREAQTSGISRSGTREAERNAVLRAFTGAVPKTVLLVSGSDSSVCEVVTSAVSVVATCQDEIERELRALRFVDLTAVGNKGCSGDEALMQWQALFDEAVRSEGVILVLPAIEAGMADGWLPMLKRELPREGLRCICRVAPEIYQREMAKNGSWRKLAEFISVQDAELSDIPAEL
jgi:hypothetical protein